jgi:hypothetical protein
MRCCQIRAAASTFNNGGVIDLWRRSEDPTLIQRTRSAADAVGNTDRRSAIAPVTKAVVIVPDYIISRYQNADTNNILQIHGFR